MSEAVVALAAGGTGGHMFPAQALAQELQRRGERVFLVTDARGARYAEGFPCDERLEIKSASPNVGGPAARLKALFAIAGGFAAALSAFRKRDVKAAVGFGGYPSFASMKAASILKIPYGVHEQNGVLGRANRMLASGASFTAHAFPALSRVPAAAAEKLQEVGNPVRDAVKMAAAAAYDAPTEDGDFKLVVFGGSQGATIFSQIVPEAIAALPEAHRKRLSIVHQAREHERDAVAAVYENAGVRHEAAPFFKDLPQRIAASHLVISRAGGSTVTELSAIGRPSILVPLGIAMDDHQTGNARVLSDADAALLRSEQSFTVDQLRSDLQSFLEAPDRLRAMAAAAQGRIQTGAAAALADLVEAISRR